MGLIINGAEARDWYGSCPPGRPVQWSTCEQCGAPIRSDDVTCTGTARHERPTPALRLYATYTGTRRNLAEMAKRGIRLVVGPDQLRTMPRRSPPPLSWLLDNGAWGCHTQGKDFDSDAFRRALDRFGDGADFIALPDIVGGGLRSLEMSLGWLDEVAAFGDVVIPVQDGMEVGDVRPHLRPGVGVFIGGTTEWKLSTMRQWGALGQEAGVHVHCGRVNSAKRIQMCIDAGVTSSDGTSPSLYAVTSERLDRASRGDKRLDLWPGL